MDTLSKAFNAVANFIFNKHTLVHLAIMAVLMTFPMIAAAVPAGAATLGDLAVHTGSMYSNMAVEGLKNLPVGADIIANTLQGNFAANTTAMASSHTIHYGGTSLLHTTTASAGDLAVHGATALSDAALNPTMQAVFNGFSAAQQGDIIAKAVNLKMTLAEYLRGYCLTPTP
ncbi:MAG: hypothetical protein L6Q57_02975 [Alphaproteobacteria bacterium]|nr:hypothetical protein [Alphaproteobacteria bacterium]